MLSKREIKKLVAFVGICFLSQIFLQISFDTRFLQNLDLDLYDYKIQLANEEAKPSDDIVIVSIDEVSLEALEGQFGRFPWDRRVWREFIYFLMDEGVSQIYFDMIFSEYSKPPVEGKLHLDDDLLMNATSSYSDQIIHGGQIINEPETQDNYKTLNLPLADYVEAELFTLPNKSKVSAYNKVLLPYDELLAVSSHIGSLDIVPDQDGIFRRVKPLRSYRDYYFKTLALAPLIQYDDEFIYHAKSLKFKNTVIPQVDGEILINLKKNFKNFSASAVFSTIQSRKQGVSDPGFFKPGELKGKDVFIAPTAAGLYDQKNTSFGRLPGVFIHASLLDSIKNNQFIQKADRNWARLIVFIMILIIAWVILYQDDIFVKLAVFLSILFLYFLGAKILFETEYIWLPSGYIISTCLAGFLTSFVYRTFYENRDKRFLKAAFKNYISPSLIDEMHESGELPKLGGDVGVRSAFFTDIANFSSFSEELTPEQLVRLINEYLTAMTDILISEGGTLDKYVGDAIIAFFGAPKFQEDHAQRAARVAIKMQRKLDDLRIKWRSDSEDWPRLVTNMVMRIGINSGDILTGNMGGVGRMNYTMMGDAVNLAARLESSAKQYGIINHISQTTAELLGDEYLVRKLDKIIVKGKTEPVTTYELISHGEQDEKILSLVQKFHQGLSYYEARNFDQAKTLFKEALQYESLRFKDFQFEVNPSKIYIDRCELFLKDPPGQDWNGIFVLTSK